MEPEDWPRIKAVFDAALLKGVNERSAYLTEACAGEKELRREVDALLASYHAADGFMERPLAGVIADQLLADDADELEPGRIFGHYQIVRKIGAGGMGNVYLAEDTLLRRSVAIKLLTAAATLDADNAARFVQEARLASLLNHPHILTIYEIGKAENLHFISTEFVPGETLRERLSRESLQTKDAVQIAIDIASALVVAHRAEIVHRDIKPENIMLREDGLLKVLDFGLAKLIRCELGSTDADADAWGGVRTAPGIILGTVKYMSPEQALGGETDERTDIWSLGVVLYEMIAGRPPFLGRTSVGTVELILRTEPAALDHDSDDVRRSLNRITRNSLTKTIDERYQTMQEMLDDLQSLRASMETGTPEPRSIAILPFANITSDVGLSFFEFALADAVITELGRSYSLVVRPSSSVAKYVGKNVDPLAAGRDLKVDAIMAGNFLLSKKRIRVTTQLIDVGDRKVLWAEQIDSDTEDIIGLQDTITHRIVEGLKCELESPAPLKVSVPATDNSSAYMEYLRGRDQLRRYMFHTAADENVDLAISHFKLAIELDPKFALAHCALGTSYLQRVLKILGNEVDVKTAAAALDRALELDPQIVDARAYRSYVTRLQGDTDRARVEISDLRREAPNNFDVQYLSSASFRLDGNYDAAFQCYEDMLRIDPTARVAIHYCRARIYWYLAKYDLAFQELQDAEKIEPNHPIVKFFHAVLMFRAGHPAVAVQEMRALLETYPCTGFRPYLAICLSAIDDHVAALAELTEEIETVAAVDPDVSYWVGSAYLSVGRMGDAIKWFRRSVWLGNNDRHWFENDPVLNPIRSDPRFLELLAGLRPSMNAG